MNTRAGIFFPDMTVECSIEETTAAGSAEYQRSIYQGAFYRRFRRLRWLFRYDCRYRLLVMEELFQRHGIPFERVKVFELGFGTGDLLLRFDTTCTVHGCELSEDAIEIVRKEAKALCHGDVKLVRSANDGGAVFPSTGYDIVIASHVLEHVPDDAGVLTQLAEHTREDGWGLFFVPLERPHRRHRHHARTYSRAGFCRLCESCGWSVIEAESNMRFDSFSENFLSLLEQHLPALAPVMEGVRNASFSLLSPGLLRASEMLFERIHKRPRQLAVLATRRQKAEDGCPHQ